MEPLTLDEAKLYLRVTNDIEDVLISSLITMARERAEAVCGRSLAVTDFPDGYPERIRQWMRLEICTWYENRERFSENPVHEISHIDRLLDAFKVPSLA